MMTAPATGRRTGQPTQTAAATWRGSVRPYDLVKEFVIALGVVALLTVGLAVLFSSPDEKGVTLQDWARANPGDFVATAAGELAGTTTSAGYGPPYNANGQGQSMGPIAPQTWAGVRIPVDPANDFVITPLTRSANDPAATLAVKQWTTASADQQTRWATTYVDALGTVDDPAAVPPGDYGPVPVLTRDLLGLAQRGVLDSDLVQATQGFYQTDYTRPLLFLGDSAYLEDIAGTHHLQGEQWGMMNETGNYPGQAWLWLYTFWYQIPPFTTAWADNADLIVWVVMMVLSLGLVLLPFIPGLRAIPLKVPLYRLIWRRYYRSAPRRPTTTGQGTTSARPSSSNS
jgi:hypothetical protein